MSMAQDQYNLVSTILLGITLLAGVSTVIVYYRQLRVMRETLDRMIRTLRSQVSADLTSKLNTYNQVEINHPEVHEFYETPYEKWDGRSHVGSLVTDMRFAVYEEAFTQYSVHELMDESAWRVWEQIILQWVRRPFFLGYWNASRPYFADSFVALVDDLLARSNRRRNAEHGGEGEPPITQDPTP
jgi:hypothetical protein